MGQTINKIARWCAVALSSLAVVSTLGLQSAGAVNFFDDVCDGATSSSPACSADNKDNISGNNGIILRAANLIAIIAGIAAVVMIIIGGFMLVTGGGDSSRVGDAKKTIIYAVVGLIVIALARTIVGFIVTRV